MNTQEQPRLPHPTVRPWLTVSEISALTGEGEKVIRAALEAGDLPLLKIGRYKRVATAALWRQLGLADFTERPRSTLVTDPEGSDFDVTAH